MSELPNIAGVDSTGHSAIPDWLELVRQKVVSLRFGTVLITVHNSRVVQVDKNERVRLDPPASSATTLDSTAK